MKYSFFKLSFAISLLGSVALGSCSSQLKDEPEKNSGEEKRLYVRVAVAPEAVGESDNSTVAERMIDPSRLYLATYTTDGKLIETFYAGADTETSKFYGSSGYGPAVAAYLDADAHKDGFVIVAHSLPATHYTLPNQGFVFKSDIKSGNFDLKMPGTSDTHGSAATLWTPSSSADDSDFIPMTGMVTVSKAVIDKYDPVVHRYSPMQLPDVLMTRAMAKVVIKDVHNIIQKAEYNLPINGYAIPASSWWWDGGDKAPQAHTNANTNVLTIIPDKEGTIVFYTYEKSFPTQASDHGARGIELYAQEGKASTAQKTIYFAPYDDKGKLVVKTAAELKDLNDGLWTGIIRNHEYTFTVTRPANGKIEIYVKVGKWTPERDTFEF